MSAAIKMGRSERCWRLNTIDCQHITRRQRAEVAYLRGLTDNARKKERDSWNDVLRSHGRDVTVECTANVAASGERNGKGLAELSWVC